MPLTPQGEKIRQVLQSGKQGVGAVTPHAVVNDVPEVSYRSSLPGGSTLQQLNESNHQFWAGQSGVGASPNESNGNEQGDGQGNNFMPGERKMAVGHEAMLTPPIEASRYNEPYESLFESSTGQSAGDESSSLNPIKSLMKKTSAPGTVASKMVPYDDGDEATFNMSPQINKSNFNKGAGVSGSINPDFSNMDGTRDDAEDQLFSGDTESFEQFEGASGKMGSGQDPHKYLQPQAGGNYTSATGSKQSPTNTPSFKPPASMSGRRDPPQVHEYKPATKATLGDLNKANQAYWEKNAPFNGSSNKSEK